VSWFFEFGLGVHLKILLGEVEKVTAGFAHIEGCFTDELVVVPKFSVGNTGYIRAGVITGVTSIDVSNRVGHRKSIW